MVGKVLSVHISAEHNLRKEAVNSVSAVAGFGLVGDAHYGQKIQHLYDQRKNPNQLNTKQIHLIAKEMIDELNEKGFVLEFGDMGENIVTQGIDYMDLSLGTILNIGKVEIELTGLRIPCNQLERYGKGMVKATVTRNLDGKVVFKNAPMGIIKTSGEIIPDTMIRMTKPTVRKPLPPI